VIQTTPPDGLVIGFVNDRETQMDKSSLRIVLVITKHPIYFVFRLLARNCAAIQFPRERNIVAIIHGDRSEAQAGGVDTDT
jgi:hypothetical protein